MTPSHPVPRAFLPLVLFSLLLLPLATPLFAAPPIDPEAVAEKLLATTVTVRISAPKPVPVSAEPSSESMRPADSIFLASGVSLGRGLIVTFYNSPGAARFRATLPDGEQADAELRVTDDYSGLRLIEIANQRLPGLELAAANSQSAELSIGMPVMTAAAMGIERPVVSLGILGGTDRALGGSGLPPLLLCDVRTTETSSGAAIVNRDGKLIGVAAAVSSPDQRSGWTYAVPVRHVERLVASRVDKQQVVLRRQRPTAGLTLGAGVKEGTVRVERVDAGGPADLAGIRSGDLLLDVEGHKIRSAYQAVDLILKKQPGDQVQLQLEQQGRNRQLALTLGGVLAPQIEPREPLESTVQVGPQTNIVVRSNKIEVRRNIGVDDESRTLADSNGGDRPSRDELSSLKAQLEQFQRAVTSLEEEIRRREAAQSKMTDKLESLEADVERLRNQPKP
jgi:S1-C subfamily serine protease